MTRLGPRLVVGGTHSGVGKTTVAAGIMTALARRGLRVGAAKVGPDFIDPGYHRLATGRFSRNLDAVLTSRDAVPAVAGKASLGCDLLIVEGVMGLFDGAMVETPPDGLAPGSTAEVAKMLQAPVVLVVDASALSHSVAAMVHGYASFHPAVSVRGVLLNRVGSDSHEKALRRAVEEAGTEVLGVVRRDNRLTWRGRHLGLVPVVERPAEAAAALSAVAQVISSSVDLERVVQIARQAPALECPELVPARRQCSRPVPVAVAGGPAFSFQYPENLERLEEAGAAVETFDPLTDEALPPGAQALYAGGGFPEVFCESLGGNTALLRDVSSRVSSGMPTWAECGGLLYLSRSLDGVPLCGSVPAEAEMTSRLSLGYRRATVLSDNPVATQGSSLSGHEFHYSVCRPSGEALRLRASNGEERLEGFSNASLLATYLHTHLAADPAPAERFVRSAAAFAGSEKKDTALREALRGSRR